MSKDKQIEEMASDFCAIQDMECVKCHLFKNTCHANKYATRAYNAGYRKASEVEEEIFGDIENVINNELQNNYKVLPQFEFSNELWNKMSGRIEALKEICDFIAELKKKYTEGEQ